MPKPLLGVHVHDFRTDPKSGLQRAARLGFGSVELRTLEGDLAPRNLSPSGRRHLLRYVRDLGLNLAALDADFGASAFADPARVDACISATVEVLALARELGVPVVTGCVGRLARDAADQQEAVLAALRAVGERADTIGTVFAVTSACNSPEMIRGLVDTLDCASIRICADPGALAMEGYDPQAAAELLADRVILSHARDGLMGSSDRGGREVPLGQGDVNWLRYLMTLSTAGYTGPQILRRTDSQRPEEDLAAAKAVLEERLSV
ncbi:MAG: sugar phosphate isomerase/epimerase [Phycisphaerae bacterium]|nr:sugar phosphate isomerase/epimerase [Phycisphaerae bacterium]